MNSSFKALTDVWGRFGARVHADAEGLYRASQGGATKGAAQGNAGVAGGVILASCGIWKMAGAKQRIDQLCNQIESAKK